MSEKSETIGALVAALAKVQGTMTGVKKDAINPFYSSKYADLASIWEAVRGPLAANGLAVIQTTEPQEGGVCVITTLAHTSGEWVSGKLFVPATKQDAQGFGSAFTYARRYALAAITGVAPEDDDGQAAVAKAPVAPGSKPTVNPADAAPLIAAIRSALVGAKRPNDLKRIAAQIMDAGNRGLLTDAQVTVLKDEYNAVLGMVKENGKAAET